MCVCECLSVLYVGEWGQHSSGGGVWRVGGGGEVAEGGGIKRWLQLKKFTFFYFKNFQCYKQQILFLIYFGTIIPKYCPPIRAGGGGESGTLHLGDLTRGRKIVKKTHRFQPLETSTVIISLDRFDMKKCFISIQNVLINITEFGSFFKSSTFFL